MPIILTESPVAQISLSSAVTDLGEGPGPPRPPPHPLFWVKNEEVTEEKKASRTRKSRPPPPLPPPPLSSRCGSATESSFIVWKIQQNRTKQVLII